MTESLKDNLIVNSNLSLAWAEAFFKVLDAPGGEVVPIIVQVNNINNQEPDEIQEIREKLDALHRKLETGLRCETTAGTIFPKSYWTPSRPRETLYERYKENWPKIRKCKQNKHGTYFYRFINYQDKYNQLEHVIETWKKDNHRRSALIASVFDPTYDHTDCRQRGFPCLQQVSFVPHSDGSLSVNAFYAKQDIFPYAYGNYLGLCRLGLFMASELGFKFDKMTCFSGIMNFGGRAKRNFDELRQQIIAITS